MRHKKCSECYCSCGKKNIKGVRERERERAYGVCVWTETAAASRDRNQVADTGGWRPHTLVPFLHLQLLKEKLKKHFVKV